MSLVFRLLILLLIIVVIEFYFFKKINSSIKAVFRSISNSKRKIILWAFVIFLNLYPAIGIVYLAYYAASGSTPVFPPPFFLFDLFIQFPFWIFVLVVVQFIVIFLPIDVLRVVLFPLYKSNKERVKIWISRIQLVALVFFVVYVPVRTAYDYYFVSTRIVEYKKENLPKALHGFKIVFISDVQADRYTNASRLKNFIDKINFASPDLVLIAGDLITSTPDYIKVSAEFLGGIESKYGVFSCVGDHDNWAYRRDTERSLKEISEELTNYNIEMVDNQKREIIIDSNKIGITFVTNTYVESIKNNFLDTLTNGDNSDNLKIFLTHQPRQFLIDKAIERKYDLFLAGHTHGGQLSFLFPFINLSPTLFETKYVRGDFYFGNMLAIVTRGLGMSLVPLRYNSTPEITVIVIYSK